MDTGNTIVVLQEYETRYQTVADSEDGGEICYVKLFNVGQKALGPVAAQASFHRRDASVALRKHWRDQQWIRIQDPCRAKHPGKLPCRNS